MRVILMIGDRKPVLSNIAVIMVYDHDLAEQTACSEPRDGAADFILKSSARGR